MTWNHHHLTVAKAVGLIMFGCCSNVVSLELLIRNDPASGHIVTFAQFFFVAVTGFFSNADPQGGLFGLRKRHIPLRFYGVFVSVFWTLSVLNNWALNYSIPLPLHMIFRSGSLIATTILGRLILKKRYTMGQYISVPLVSVGIYIATTADAGGDTPSMSNASWTGIIMLTVALFLSASLGVTQEYVYGRFGKHTTENMFYTHLFSLPFFALVGAQIWSRASLWAATNPVMFVYLAANCLTQWVCIRGVYTMTGVTNSLSMTLTITVRKFVSLVFSVLYFNNPFSQQHWFATTLVFTGSLMYMYSSARAKTREADTNDADKAE